jgi:tetratricopeptide (TPR) repeat protein
MRARHDLLAEQDLAAAYAVAAVQDEVLALAVMLDRVDLATAAGQWESAADLVPELLRRTEASGDPLLQAMGLNRCGWAALGAGDLEVAGARYRQAWALAGLHEDAVVESRSAAGVAAVAGQAGELEVARSAWRQSLGLAERLHDRGFTLHCLDGIALLLAYQGRWPQALQLLDAGAAARRQLGQPREVPVEDLLARVREEAPSPSGEVSDPPMGYVEALAAARAAVARP